MTAYIGPQGKYLTTSLFVERNKRDPDALLQPVFSLTKNKHSTRTGIRSLKKIYMDAGDPTGYLPAIEAFGSWEHWNVLKNLPWFARHLESWEDELRAKIISQSVLGIMTTALDIDDKRSLQAQRYLATEGWSMKKAGRPSKADIENNNIKSNSLKALVAEDAERLGLL